MERARRRMMAAVPEATVVITNPTHYAVALRYEPERMAAPRLVAKGADTLARRIREVARAHGVPLIENPPLARTYCGGRSRRRDPAGPLPGRGRDHRSRDAAAARSLSHPDTPPPPRHNRSFIRHR